MSIPVTLIPPPARINGLVETPGDLEIQGRCDGRIEVEGTLLVAAKATCRATVRARAARILGEVIGDVICSDSIEVAASGRVVGDLRAPDIAVDASAEVDGRVDLLPPAPENVPLRRLPISARGPAIPRPLAPPRQAKHKEP